MKHHKQQEKGHRTYRRTYSSVLLSKPRREPPKRSPISRTPFRLLERGQQETEDPFPRFRQERRTFSSLGSPVESEDKVAAFRDISHSCLDPNDFAVLNCILKGHASLSPLAQQKAKKTKKEHRFTK
ncbi:hypothetical protein TNCV_3191221 [Trichonephila clavipes]|nr:hypothetical protein TNCV_3191221 [Trichonephila clavipes]